VLDDLLLLGEGQIAELGLVGPWEDVSLTLYVVLWIKSSSLQLVSSDLICLRILKLVFEDEVFVEGFPLFAVHLLE